MPARRPQAIKARSGLIAGSVADAATSRALDDVAAAIGKLEERYTRSKRTVDLVVGTNRVAHGLGRIPAGANLTPTVADASFAWAMSEPTARTVTITVVGVAQPGAGLEFY